MRSPGPAFTSTMPAPRRGRGCEMSGRIRSIPQMSRPITRAARSQSARTLGIDLVGDVGRGAAGREVGARTQPHRLPLLRNVVERDSLSVQRGEQQRILGIDARERLGVALAALRIAVELFDQIGDRALSVTAHLRWITQAGRDHRAADHEHAVVPALVLLLDQHVARDRRGVLERGAQRLERGHPGGHSLALIAVDRLDHDALPQVFPHLDRLVEAS